MDYDPGLYLRPFKYENTGLTTMNKPTTLLGHQTFAIQKAMDLALGYRTAGRLFEAEGACNMILQAEPNQPEALHLLGVIAHQVGKNEIAIELIEKAIIIKTDFAEAYSNLGLIFKEQGQLGDAVDSFHKAISIKPDYTEAHNNLGNILQALGKIDEAMVSFKKAIAIDPVYAAAHSNLGNAQKGLGKLDEAVASYNKAITINPDYAEVHSNLGVVLHELGKLDNAVMSFNKAVSIMPDFAEAHNNLGRVFETVGKLDEAIASYNKALVIKPGFSKAHSNLGNAYKKSGKYDKAIKSYTLAEKSYDSENTNYERPNFRSMILECYYINNDMIGFRECLQTISRGKGYNFRAGAASAFVAQQVHETNIYEFCINPIDLVTGYNVLKDEYLFENKALLDKLEKDICRGNWNREFSPGHISCGYKSIGNLFDDSTEQILSLETLLRCFIDSYFETHRSKKSLFINNWPKDYELDGWYIQLAKGGEISAHVHTGWASGVLYLRTPENSSDGEGNIEFTLRGYDLPVIRDDYPRKIIKTEPGVLVLFPSSLPHRVIPFSSNEERICIAFDMKPCQVN